MNSEKSNHESLAAPLVVTLARNVQIARKNTAGIGQADSLLSVADGGSTLNWLIGHMVASRDGMLKMLGSETTWDAERAGKYQRGSAVPEAADVEELEQLLVSLERSQELLAAALGAAAPELLAQPSDMPDTSKLEWLEFLSWHDTYHTGQTAVYRRLAGLAGTLG